MTPDLKLFYFFVAEDYGGFLRKSPSMSSAYEVNLKHAIIEFTWCVLSNGVDAKFGSNAARIFRYFFIKSIFYYINMKRYKHLLCMYLRLIREQEYIEQDEIQKKAMLPDKEAKFLTYSLLQSGWIQQHELKKSLQKSGPTKTFYLFCIDFDQVRKLFLHRISVSFSYNFFFFFLENFFFKK